MHLSYLAATLLIVKHLLVAPKVRDSWEELLDVETDWDEFLSKVKRIVFIYVFNTSSIANRHNPTLKSDIKTSKKSILPTMQVDSGEADGLCKGDLAPLQLPLLEARVFFLQMLPLSRFRDEIKRIISQKSCSSKAFL